MNGIYIYIYYILYYICIGNDKPDIILLNSHVREDAAPHWRDIAEQLLKGAVHLKLNSIEERYHHDVMKCCEEILKYWLDNFEATWNKLIDALKQSGQSEIAATIETNDALKGL